LEVFWGVHPQLIILRSGVVNSLYDLKKKKKKKKKKKGEGQKDKKKIINKKRTTTDK